MRGRHYFFILSAVGVLSGLMVGCNEPKGPGPLVQQQQAELQKQYDDLQRKYDELVDNSRKAVTAASGTIIVLRKELQTAQKDLENEKSNYKAVNEMLKEAQSKSTECQGKLASALAENDRLRAEVADLLQRLDKILTPPAGTQETQPASAPETP